MTIRIDGEKIREMREDLFYSQRELSRLSGLSHETIQRVEAGERLDVRGATVRKFAQALNVDPHELLLEEDAEPYTRGPVAVEPGAEEEVRLPLNIEAITEKVMEVYEPENTRDLRDALNKFYAYRLETWYTREELFEFKDRLSEEASRLGAKQRGSREDIRRIPPEDWLWRMYVIENINAITRVLDRTAGRQVRRSTSGEEAE